MCVPEALSEDGDSSAAIAATAAAVSLGAPVLAPLPEARAAITTENLMLLLRRREVLAICITQYAQSWGIYGASPR